MDSKWLIITGMLCFTAIAITGAIGFAVYHTKHGVGIFKARREEDRMDERHREEMQWIPKTLKTEYDRQELRLQQEQRALSRGSNLGEPAAPLPRDRSRS